MEFHNEIAQQYFNDTYEELKEIFIKPVDRIALMNLSNLYAQSQELLRLVRDEGYRVVNENSRGGVTYIANPTYSAYLKTVAQMDVLQSKLGLNIKSRQALKQKELELQSEEDELFGDV